MMEWFTVQKPSKGCPEPAVMDCVSALTSSALSETNDFFCLNRLYVMLLEMLSGLAVHSRESTVHCRQ